MTRQQDGREPPPRALPERCGPDACAELAIDVDIDDTGEPTAIDKKHLLARSVHLRNVRGQMKLTGVSTGMWRARGVRIEELRVDLKAEGVAFENSRVDLHLDVELGFQVPSLRSKEPKVYKTGPVPGHVATPTLRRINLSSLTRELGVNFVLSSITAAQASADVAPLKNLDLGPALVSGIQLQGLSAPGKEGLGLSGLHLGGLTLENLGIPGAFADRLNVERLRAGKDICASDVVIRGATLQDAKVGAVAGGELNLGFEVHLPTMKIKTFPELPPALERLVTRLWLEIKPRVVFHVGNVNLEGLTLSTKVGALRLKSLCLPLDATGIQTLDVALQDLGVEGVKLT